MEFFAYRNISELWVTCGTKFGKTLGASTGICSATPLAPKTKGRWVAPIYSQSKIGLDYCNNLLPGKPYCIPNLSDMSITFPHVQSKINFCHAQDPKSLEGEAIHRYILDECAKMKAEVYPSIKTTTTVTRGQILGLTTPLGKNWVYHRAMEAKEEMKLARRQGRQPRLLHIQARTIDNPFVLKEAVAEAKLSMPDRLFRQYYLAEFIDDSTVFSGFSNCLYGEEIFLDGTFQRWVSEEAKSKRVVIGADWAKTTDYTVFTAFSYEDGPPKIIGIVRFQGEDYISAVKHLIRFSREFKECSTIFHDKTGIGSVIDDLLNQTNLPFEGVTFTNSSKSFMINNLIVGIQKNNILLPNWSELKKEMDGYEVTVNDLGNMKYSAPSGQHDDIVCSIMLGYSASCDLSGGNFSVRIAEEIDEKLLTIDSWYSDMIEEYEDNEYNIGVF